MIDSIENLGKAIFPSRERILRAIQIDNQCIEELNKKIIELFEALSNFKVFSFSSEVIEFTSSFLYYYVSYNLHPDGATSGEEYTEIKKVNLQQNTKKSFLYILLRSALNNVIKKWFIFLMEKISKKLAPVSVNLRVFSPRLHLLISSLSKTLTWESFFEKLEEFQYILFFLNGYYLDTLNLAFDVFYKNTSANSAAKKNLIHSSGFKILGYLILIKNVWEGFIFTRNLMRTYYDDKKKQEIDFFLTKYDSSNIDKEGLTSTNLTDKNKKLKLKKNEVVAKRTTNPLATNYDEEERKCFLCLDERKNTSATICGHLFCWDCIIEYLQENPNCPFCRSKCEISSVILLSNFN